MLEIWIWFIFIFLVNYWTSLIFFHRHIWVYFLKHWRSEVAFLLSTMNANLAGYHVFCVITSLFLHCQNSKTFLYCFQQRKEQKMELSLIKINFWRITVFSVLKVSGSILLSWNLNNKIIRKHCLLNLNAVIFFSISFYSGKILFIRISFWSIFFFSFGNDHYF